MTHQVRTREHRLFLLLARTQRALSDRADAAAAASGDAVFLPHRHLELFARLERLQEARAGLATCGRRHHGRRTLVPEGEIVDGQLRLVGWQPPEVRAAQQTHALLWGVPCGPTLSMTDPTKLGFGGWLGTPVDDRAAAPTTDELLRQLAYSARVAHFRPAPPPRGALYLGP